jgi:hypothetical protein
MVNVSFPMRTSPQRGNTRVAVIVALLDSFLSWRSRFPLLESLGLPGHLRSKGDTCGTSREEASGKMWQPAAAACTATGFDETFIGTHLALTCGCHKTWISVTFFNASSLPFWLSGAQCSNWNTPVHGAVSHRSRLCTFKPSPRFPNQKYQIRER